MKRLLFLTALLFISVKASAAEPITLRYNFPAATEITYKVQTATVSRFRGLGETEQELSGRITQTAVYRLLETSPQGEMTWEQAVQSGAVEITAGDETQKNDLPQGKLRFRLTPLGKITLRPKGAGEETAPEAPSQALAGDSRELDLLFGAIFLPLPEAAVKPGDTWETAIPVGFSPLPGATPNSPEAQSLKVKSELLAFTKQQGKSCAKIRTSLSLPFDHCLARPGGSSLRLTGRLAADILWYFVPALSRTLSADGGLQIVTEIAPAEVKSPELRSSVTIKSNTKTTLLE